MKPPQFHHLDVVMTEDLRKRIGRLQDLSGNGSPQEVIAKALMFYEWTWEEQLRNGKLVINDSEITLGSPD